MESLLIDLNFVRHARDSWMWKALDFSGKEGDAEVQEK